MAVAIRRVTNFLRRATGMFDDTSYPFPNDGERQPTGIQRPQENFGYLVSSWLLVSTLSLMEETNKTKDAIKEVVLRNVRGLLILEDGKYVSWPDEVDPGKDPSKVVAERAATLRNFASELYNWPPETSLRLVEDPVAQQ